MGGGRGRGGRRSPNLLTWGPFQGCIRTLSFPTASTRFGRRAPKPQRVPLGSLDELKRSRDSAISGVSCRSPVGPHGHGREGKSGMKNRLLPVVSTPDFVVCDDAIDE